jgi:putative ABC transport system permease protein
MAKLPAGGGGGFFGPPEVDLGIALVAAAVLTIAGALAGLAPARSAVAIRPVEALAHE